MNRNSPDADSPDPVVIRSAANAQIRRLVRLRENNRFRRRAGLVIVDGWRLISRLIAMGNSPETIFLSQDDRLKANQSRGLPCTVVSPSIMSRIAYGQTDSPVVGVFHHALPTLDDFKLPSDGLVLVADRIEKPGNLGAIYRTADAAGVAAVLLCGGGDPGHPTAIRNSQAATLTLPTASGSQHDIARRLQEAGFRVHAARVESSLAMDEVDLTPPTAIVVGNEAEGLASRWQESWVSGIHIPMAGVVDSLNVSVSAAILLMDAARQRRVANSRKR